jgi:orotidine-5'-phosphate decarboxylase
MPQNDFLSRLTGAIARAGVPLCIGLDPDPKLMPAHLGSSAKGLRSFLTALIEATRDLVAAYKPNTAFFEAYGPEGWEILAELRDIIGPNALMIADAKRGDVEHTNDAYARALFDLVKADAVTVSPYLGGAPLAPFCCRPDKGMFVLCATSNAGAEEVQDLKVGARPLYLEIARLAKQWQIHPNVGLVVGTTKPDALHEIAALVPDLPLLLPGGGTQGGDTRKAMGILRQTGSLGLFNFSRQVIYASNGMDFALRARAAVEKIREEMKSEIRNPRSGK